MQIAISSRKTVVTPRLEEVVHEKVGRLEKFLDGMDRAEVHFAEEKNPRQADRKEFCEVTMHGHGHHVRAKVNAPDPFTAIDLAVDKLEHQLHKLKTKLRQRHQGAPKAKKGVDSLGAVVPVPDVEPEAEVEVDDGPKIVKSKRFAMFPMSAEEAVERMELVGHGFFFFTNAETSRAAVVYRRDDGQIGLIDEAD